MDNRLQRIGIRVCIPVCALLLLASTAGADEMKIKLKSGSTVKITYTGQIQGVEVVEGNDAIETMNIHATTPPAPAPAAPAPQPAAKAPASEPGIRLKMAPPLFGDD